MDGAITKVPLGEKGTGPNPTDRGKKGTTKQACQAFRCGEMARWGSGHGW